MKNENKNYNFNQYSQIKINEKKIRRTARTRGKIKGTEDKPRLSIFRSNKNIYVQVINDETGKVLLSAHNDLKKSFEVGEKIASKSLEKKFEKVVFDRGGYKYHGNVKKVAEGARKGGLKF